MIVVITLRVHRASLWILGEYATSSEDIQNMMTQIRQALGEVRSLNLVMEFWISYEQFIISFWGKDSHCR